MKDRPEETKKPIAFCNKSNDNQPSRTTIGPTPKEPNNIPQSGLNKKSHGIFTLLFPPVEAAAPAIKPPEILSMKDKAY
jgi:hypothetical protein